MHKFRVIFLLVVLFLSGCSVVNFSANYYTPPENYQNEIRQVWAKLNTQFAFKYDYKVSIIGPRDSDRLDGVPAISNRNVLLPEDFVKYVYQNYYEDRFKIFTSVIVHEISHSEFGLPSKPADEHFKTDVMAIQRLGNNIQAAEYFYKSLYVMRNYWFARKGMAGHALNTSWNAINFVSMTLGGPGVLVDWYATDLTRRMDLIAKHYGLESKHSFRRSQQ